ncbi:hypothetical protein POSPLADRAFT_1044007 [Postia placenta MAD-698-R-SB12]|uniref:Uncharacterized protein n=1 Tax=Postia placenta MAD-698-R-SB12 TaxID=670580 RepID=A0A1X6NE32_9APHY|nr:hypothetical protein POSPLADRAFT_1044007 [Postia placenta MAD-698-R-SB12]OSX66633.1 hypothetical protein POSPLADRAFT_1044007 [Postia placenta MAD-698-R-SB12]
MTDVTCNEKAAETNWRVLVHSLPCETETTREQLELSWIKTIQVAIKCRPTTARETSTECISITSGGHLRRI